MPVVDSPQVPIYTELGRGSGGTSHGQDAATIATTTGLGALIGAAADWGTGAAIGAGAGAAAGIGAVLLTRGRPTILDPEAQLSFRLVDPVRIDTTQSQQAFLPVTQQDFDGGRSERRGPRPLAGGDPPSGPPPLSRGLLPARHPHPPQAPPLLPGLSLSHGRRNGPRDYSTRLC